MGAYLYPVSHSPCPHSRQNGDSWIRSHLSLDLKHRLKASSSLLTDLTCPATIKLVTNCAVTQACGCAGTCAVAVNMLEAVRAEQRTACRAKRAGKRQAGCGVCADTLPARGYSTRPSGLRRRAPPASSATGNSNTLYFPFALVAKAMRGLQVSTKRKRHSCH